MAQRHPILRSGLVTTVFTAALVATGCTNVQNSLDCTQICDRYKDCFDTNYDTDSCHTRCSTSADNDAGSAHQVATCSTCISGISCTAAVFNCGTECAGIVP